MSRKNTRPRTNELVAMTVRMPLQVHRELVQRAARQHRSANAELVLTLQRSLRRNVNATGVST